MPGRTAGRSGRSRGRRSHPLTELWEISLPATFTFVNEVKRSRRRGTSRISSKHQVTIPTEALREAGLDVGERLVARADGPGRVVLEREHDVLGEFAGALTGTFEHDELGRLREEWA